MGLDGVLGVDLGLFCGVSRGFGGIPRGRKYGQDAGDKLVAENLAWLRFVKTVFWGPGHGTKGECDGEER